MLGRLLVGADPLDIEGRVEAMQQALPFNTTTRSAFDMALWDILGGFRPAAVCCPWRPAPSRPPDNTVGIDTPERMAERAADHKARGFQIVKVKLGEMVETDVERLRLPARPLVRTMSCELMPIRAGAASMLAAR